MDLPISRRICVFTGSRAEYSLLRPLIREIEASRSLTLSLLVAGSHLSPAHGLTVSEIEADGYPMLERVEMVLASDSAIGVSTSLGIGVIGIAGALQRLQPSIVVILGDRYEAFACGAAACIAGVPIAHIHGGEITEGAIDDTLRHCLTKMSHLHFVSTPTYRDRVIQLGEDPASVFVTGALAVDAILETTLLTREELQSNLGIQLRETTILVTVHPETAGEGATGELLQAVLDALAAFPEAAIVFTAANNDVEGAKINDAFRALVNQHPQRLSFFMSLGGTRYLSLVKESTMVLGNSSSGIYEAPFLGIPTVNIGDRQRGRQRSLSVIDVPSDPAAIGLAIKQASDDMWRAKHLGGPYPFGDGTAGRQMRVILEAMTSSNLQSKKRFYDLPLSPELKSEQR